PPLAGGWRAENGALDFRPLLAALAGAREPASAAALFHATLAAGFTDWAARAAEKTGIGLVAAAGGCLLNRLLARGLREGLTARGLRFATAERLPPNDGGLALGQAWIVAGID
ncbi:MAG: carbamoyltransferase HypF, partial [Sulfuritalea sp.]|nr:carbamoyltransferase HypF [Sulfuritalea sp.]